MAKRKSKKSKSNKGCSTIIGIVIIIIALVALFGKEKRPTQQTKPQQNNSQKTQQPEKQSAKEQDNLQYIDADYIHRGNSSVFPKRVNEVKTYEQVGPESWESTNIKLPDKLYVEIMEHIKGKASTGDLAKVRCYDCGKTDTYIVSKDSLSALAYWDCSNFSGQSWVNGLKYGSMITRLSNENAEVLTRFDKKWVDLNSFDPQNIFCPKQRFTREEVECEIYKSTNSGLSYFTTVIFRPSDLECVQK